MVQLNNSFFLLLYRGTLDLNLKHAAIEKKSNHDIHARKMREKERDLKYVNNSICFTFTIDIYFIEVSLHALMHIKHFFFLLMHTDC